MRKYTQLVLVIIVVVIIIITFILYKEIGFLKPFAILNFREPNFPH